MPAGRHGFMWFCKEWREPGTFIFGTTPRLSTLVRFAMADIRILTRESTGSGSVNNWAETLGAACRILFFADDSSVVQQPAAQIERHVLPLCVFLHVLPVSRYGPLHTGKFMPQIPEGETSSFHDGVARPVKRNLFVFIHPTGASGNIPMTLVPGNPPVARIPARTVKKAPAQGKASFKGIFGLLSDWKIDTQAYRDEMRG